MLIRDNKKFWIGFAGLFTFIISLVFWIYPGAGHKSGLEKADEFFNQLAKNSADNISVAANKALKFNGYMVDLSVDPRWPEADQKVFKILTANMISASVIGDGRVRLKADLGFMSEAALRDAELIFRYGDQQLMKKYDMEGKEVIYFWWTVFDDLTRRYIQLNKPVEADFAKFVATRVLEPSYNFEGITPINISEKIYTAVLLLFLYIVFTVWYGFSIMYLFEGFGIVATRSAEKKEV